MCIVHIQHCVEYKRNCVAIYTISPTAKLYKDKSILQFFRVNSIRILPTCFCICLKKEKNECFKRIIKQEPQDCYLQYIFKRHVWQWQRHIACAVENHMSESMNNKKKPSAPYAKLRMAVSITVGFILQFLYLRLFASGIYRKMNCIWRKKREGSKKKTINHGNLFTVNGKRVDWCSSYNIILWLEQYHHA